MPRFVRTKFDDCVNVQLMCGCHIMKSPTAVFERKEFDCVWEPTEHGSQAWVQFAASDSGYVVECVQRGCKVRRSYSDRFESARSFARSHAGLHGHETRLVVDKWVGQRFFAVTLDLPGF